VGVAGESATGASEFAAMTAETADPAAMAASDSHVEGCSATEDMAVAAASGWGRHDRARRRQSVAGGAGTKMVLCCMGAAVGGVA
jgi:hypothetical protein